MAEDKPRELALYTCNKYLLKLDGEEVTFCNAPEFCDAETRQRRRCTRVKVVFQSSQGPGAPGP